jgi:predicted acyl esterase
MTYPDAMRRQGRSPVEAHYPALNPRQERENGLVIDRDTAITLRDGVTIFVDIFRPENGSDLPIIIGWGPYGKCGQPIASLFFKNGGLTDDSFSPYTAFEAPDPLFWCEAGYAVAIVDPRGAWWSEGEANYWGARQEGEDAYDVIEWLAAQPWSNGKVGMSGVSYFTLIQWRAAAARPPSLAAINPWEGFRDAYREIAFLGGIPDEGFVKLWQTTSYWSTQPVEDVCAMINEHPLYDEYWASKISDLAEVDIPAYIVASWSDQGLHTRGTISAFNELSSSDKWLEVHGRKKWEYYYRPESLRRQRAFFDHFLRGQETEITSWPRVRLELRDSFYVGVERQEAEWPLARTQYRELYLDGAQRRLASEPVAAEVSATYGADANFSAQSYGDSRIEFDYTFQRDTEVTGHMKLRLWVEARGANDMDMFVAVQKFDANGTYVGFPFFSAQEDGPVALGWLRVSHRALDDARSTAWQPWHKHDREELLTPGEIVPVEIEIWPSSTLFRSNERLRLIIQGSDIYKYGPGTFTSDHVTRNAGRHVVYCGGQYDSHLLIPVTGEADETMHA